MLEGRVKVSRSLFLIILVSLHSIFSLGKHSTSKPNSHYDITEGGGAPEWVVEWDRENDGPSPRQGHSILYWEQDNSLILFGGINENDDALSDVWFYDTLQREWSEVEDSLHWVTAYASHVAVLREETDEMIIFGGMSAGLYGASLTTEGSNKVWIFNLISRNWSMNPELPYSPSGRADSVGAIYEDALYIHGGFDMDTYEIFNDLWKYDFQLQEWELLHVGDSYSPSARMGHAASILGSSLILHGGRNEALDVFSDVWEFDFEELIWKTVDQDPGFERAYHSMVSYNGRVWLFGGLTAVQVTTTQFSVYAFSRLLTHDFQETKWKEYVPSIVPFPRFHHRAVVTSSGTMYISGGRFEDLEDVIDLVSIDLSAITDGLLEVAESDDLTGTTTVGSSTYIVVGMAIVILSSCLGCCVYQYVIRMRDEHRRQEQRRQNLANGLIQNQRGEDDNQVGLSEDVLRNMPLELYKGEPPDGLEGNKHHEQSEVDACSICLVDLEENQEIQRLPCKHIFHPQCIRHWLAKHAICPMCKQEFDSTGNLANCRSSPIPNRESSQILPVDGNNNNQATTDR
mmetsp:Transcript_30329/g.38906  ORF Transcript_30329/g.38906 Transcript_30329/m.38906 type:complete len:571 (+) Transcript_30329:235-1947(+)